MGCRKLVFISFIFSFSILFFPVAGTTFAETIVDTDIASDTTWTASDGPYIVTDTISVLPGATLTVESGVVVKFDYGTELDVQGQLFVQGDSASPVYFTSLADDSVAGDTNADADATSPQDSDWNGILFSNQFEPSHIDNAIIAYTYSVLDNSSKDLSISNTIVEQSAYGIVGVGSHMNLTNFSAKNISNTGIYVYQSSNVTASHIVLDTIGGDGIDIYDGSYFSGDDIDVHTVTYGGIETYTNSHSTLSGVSIDRVKRGDGISAYTDSSVDMTQVTLANIADVGVNIFENSNSTISNLAVTSTSREAVAVFDNSKVVADTVMVPNVSYYAGVSVFDTASFIAKNLTLHNSTGKGDGVEVFNGGLLDITNSKISGFSKGAGIVVFGNNGDYPLSSLFIHTTKIEGNDTGLSLYTSIGEHSISNNSIKDNLSVGLEFFGSGTVNVENNFWGDASGPYNSVDNIDGVGNEIFYIPDTNVVTFSPWLETESGSAVCCSNVLFLPGIEASRLYRSGRVDEGGGEIRLWEPGSNRDVRELFLDENGKAQAPLVPEYEVYTRDVVDEAYLNNAGPNIYKTFLGNLEKLRSVDHVIADYSAVAYDWRLSLDDILNGGTKTGDVGSEHISYREQNINPYIISELTRLVQSSKTGKVTIVAHSNGGLVAKALLAKLAQVNDPLVKHIDKVIFVAVPQVGTPEAIVALLHGYDQGIPTQFPFILSEQRSREFAHNLAGAYNLLPSTNYFTYVDTPVIKFDTSALGNWATLYGDTVHSQERMHNFLVGSLGRVSADSKNTFVPDSLSEELLTQAEAVHTLLDNWTAPKGVQVTEVAGWGVPSTMSGVLYTKQRCFRISCGFLSKTVVPEPQWTVDGDGTVVTPSALWMGGNGVARYWVDLRGYNTDSSYQTGFGLFPFNHNNLLEVKNLETFIKNIITNQSLTILPQYISTTTPVADPKDTRLIYTLHSPLALNVYDTQGRHTGISTTTKTKEENIPGTTFVSIGDSQYVFTTASSTNTIVISNPNNHTDDPLPITGGGSSNIPFTFSMTELSGDDVVASTTFADIPSTASTTATIDTYGNDISSTSPLIVDTTGDGTPDIIIPPELNGVVTAPVENPVVDNPVAQYAGSNGPIISSLPVQTQNIGTVVSNPQNQTYAPKLKIGLVEEIPSVIPKNKNISIIQAPSSSISHANLVAQVASSKFNFSFINKFEWVLLGSFVVIGIIYLL